MTDNQNPQDDHQPPQESAQNPFDGAPVAYPKEPVYTPFDVDALVPEEFKQAKDSSQNQPAAKPPEGAGAEDVMRSIFSDSPEDDTPKEPSGESQGGGQQVEQSEQEPEDSDSVDNILDQVLSPDKRQSAKEDSEQDEYKFFWKEDARYKELENTLRRAGYPTEKVDEFLASVRDKSILENSKYVQSLESDRERLKKELDDTTQESIRLKNIEKAAYFDSLPETKERYTTPMANALSDIGKILELDGSGVSLQEVALSPTRSDLNNLLSRTNLSDNEFQEVSRLWRSYKETQQDYTLAKQHAQNLSRESLSTVIPDEQSQKIMNNVINKAISEDGSFDYIKNAVFSSDSLDNHEEASTVIALAKENFKNILKAFGNPKDVAHNTHWLQEIAKHELEYAHNRAIAKRYQELKSRVDEKDANLRKLAEAYKRLRDSAGGISNSNKRPVYVNGKTQSGSTRESKVFSDFIKGKAKLEDLFSK